MRNGRVEFGNGVIGWYLDGQLHRTNGPAIIFPNGETRWYLNGRPHRTNGPAIERINGTCEWIINGKPHTFEKWCDRVDIDEKTRTFLRLKYR